MIKRRFTRASLFSNHLENHPQGVSDQSGFDIGTCGRRFLDFLESQIVPVGRSLNVNFQISLKVKSSLLAVV